MRKVFALCLLAAVAAPVAHAGKLVCWNDEKGQRTCGDRMPPQYAKDDHQELDAQGRVVVRKGKQKSAEQVAEEERQVVAAKEEAVRFEKQAKYDRFLLQTFNSVQELEQSRDSRLRALNGQIVLTDKSTAEAEKTLQGLQVQVDAAKKAGKPPAPELLKQVKMFEKSLADNRQARQARLKDQEEIKTKFAADIDRYSRLRSHQSEVGSMPTPPPSAAPAAAPAPQAAPATPAAAPAPAPAPAAR